MRAVRYRGEERPAWDNFVRKAKNGLFLFFRDYMDYHADRFEDHSLLFYDEADKLCALLPANRREEALISHGGLTFGGVVSDERMTTAKMLEVFAAIADHARQEGLHQLVYKAVPHIYHTVPAEEDRYSLFLQNAILLKREVTSAINLATPLKLSKGRKCGISKAKKAGIEIRPSDDYDSFMAIEARLLLEKYGTKPVHSTAELQLLAGRFPGNIKLFGAFCNDELHAGLIIYSGANVAHVQYMATTEAGRECGALDLLVQQVIALYADQVRFFDFGISTEEGGRILNAGLLAQKEMFGARAVVHDTYQWDLT
ncbi:hypothetical protein JCM30471_11780 [Desulfuromonas carbonis]|uniref:GNAT family N-acetyltransferase n=1 Tax=Desulfuromonas sp. DDH964 TaxID=1823759 RepID=UPI00078B9F86|nr:GNAT family N-acetyltransferase [Desulfuromonas sp. DDH964]AMV72662.1 hypothetical protein DBW_2325 [Desulfuromonas sp. DDH964]